MKNSFYYTTLFIVCFVFKLSVAQNYPVKATLQLSPPYSGYLLDYTDESNEKLKVLLTLNDVNVSNYNIKLLFSIEGNGYSIKTKQTFLAAPITLQGGVPELLGAYELNPYFATQNLLFAGLNTSIYQQNKSLPEGYYTISVTAYDYSSAEPKQVSNTATSSAWFTLSDPPQPISPNCGEQINLATTPQLVFQWLNQSISPYGQNNTEYVLELFEVRPDTKNPNDAIQSSLPVFTTTVEQAIFIYGPAEIPLLEGMLYAWRVKAKDKNGRLAYKNNGHSTVCTFRYGSKYAALESQTQLTLSIDVQTHRMAMATWDSIPEFTDYTFLYKKASGNYNWRCVNLSEARKKIYDLEPNTTYQAKVKGQVEDYTSPESNTVTFTTLPAQSFTCNSANTTLNPAELNVPLLQQATQDMIFTVGMFEMQVTQITGSNGQFSGKGIMFKGVFKLPVLVQFNNISVNQNQVVVAGEVYAITTPKSRMVLDLDVAWENIQQLLNELNTHLSNGDTAAANNAVALILQNIQQSNLPDSVKNAINQEGLNTVACNNGCLVPNGKLPGGKGNFLDFDESTTNNCQPCDDAFAALLSQTESSTNEQRIETQTKVFEIIAQIKNANIKNTTLFVEDYPHSPANMSASYLRINGVIYENIYIQFVNSGTAVSPRNNIKIETHSLNGINTKCIDVQNRIRIYVKSADKLDVLRTYLMDVTSANSILLFVNGYRRNGINPVEHPNTNNNIYFEDPLSYWEGINHQFIARVQSKTIIYADGHHSITTSNHFTLTTFLDRYLRAQNTCNAQKETYINGEPTLIKNPCYHNITCMELSTTTNTRGFNERKTNGTTAGKAMVNKITSGKIVFNKTSDVVDIVCHSMGFAYAQGMIQELKNAGIKLGRYYILAPENASSGSVTLSDFEEVWQYGSDGVNDPIWEQDGVAAQVAVGNLNDFRVYIPDDKIDFTKNFTESHSIKNYKWIFNKPKTEPGYVKKRQ